MAFRLLHRALDDVAVWTEDRIERPPEPFRIGDPAPLRCFGPLPDVPASSPSAGAWSAPSPLPLRPGDRMSVRATPAARRAQGTALLVPPWKIGSPDLVSGYTRLLVETGCDVWLVSPPHHLERALDGARSGEGFVTLDLDRLRAAFEQLVFEVRVLAALAARRGPVGVVGLSLGGLGAALAATAPEPLDWVAVVAPPHLPLVLADTGIGRRYRRLAALAGSRWPDHDELASALAPLDPAARKPSARRLFVAGARYDRIAPIAGPLRLAEAWGIPLGLYPRGHISLLFLCRALRKDLAKFVSGRTR